MYPFEEVYMVYVYSGIPSIRCVCEKRYIYHAQNLPIMLLNNVKNQVYYAQYYAFNIIIMLSILLFYWLLY